MVQSHGAELFRLVRFKWWLASGQSHSDKIISHIQTSSVHTRLIWLQQRGNYGYEIKLLLKNHSMVVNNWVLNLVSSKDENSASHTYLSKVSSFSPTDFFLLQTNIIWVTRMLCCDVRDWRMCNFTWPISRSLCHSETKTMCWVVLFRYLANLRELGNEKITEI